MAVSCNFVTPKSGEPLIVPLQDFLTASYLLTNKDRFYDRASFMQTCCYFSPETERVKMPSPSIIKPIPLWTGKQIISIMLKPNNDKKWPLINLETPTKTYPKNSTDSPYRLHKDPLDRYVVIKDSVHLSGSLDKKILGSSKIGLFATILKTAGPKMTALIMGRLSKLCARWLAEFGFSIGIDDVMPSEQLTAAKNALMDRGYKDCNDYELLFKQGKLKPQPGCTGVETLEAKMLGKLSDIREMSGKNCIESLSYFKNSPIVMATCGSKGSTINIAQMVACVGQQALQSGRIPEGFVNRTLPHFPKFSRSPEAKGFVRNSFYTGLTATEFFFHTMAGREGLVDTAVKTAETGYMQRRLMKALEDGCVQYDNTVRNCENVVMQFTYGDDGLDPVDCDEGIVDFGLILRHIMSRDRRNGMVKSEIGLTPKEIEIEVENRLRTIEKESKVSNFEIFRKSLKKFVKIEIVDKMNKTRRKLKIENKEEKIAAETFCNKVYKITLSQIKKLFDEGMHKYKTSFVEPGTAVGAIGAQSIGEPSTQMTLKTFHFAGVASMNITLGVPRIKEIVNSVTKIKTPIINAALDCVNSEQVARIIKGKLEITTLGGVCKFIRQFICNNHAFIEILIDKETVGNLMLEITVQTVKDAILRNKKLNLKECHVIIVDEYKIRIISPDKERNTLLFSLKRLALLLPKIQVKGIKDIHRAVIRHPDPIRYRWEYLEMKQNSTEKKWKAFLAKENAEIEKQFKKGEKTVLIPFEFLRDAEICIDLDEENGVYKAVILPFGREVPIRRVKVEYELTVEGIDFIKAMTTSGVDGLNTTTNLIPQVERFLGIEAAREAIIRELLFTFSVHGLVVDMHHIMLLADVMTFKGQVLGITRFGISKMKDSVLMQASFETPMDHLFAASTEGESDPIKGVSECIMLGTTMPIGSGIFQMLRKVDAFKSEEVENIF